LPPNCVSTNPEGKAAAVAGEATKVSEAAIPTSRIDFKLNVGCGKSLRLHFVRDRYRTTVIQDPLGIKALPSISFNLELI
jgi:hypothetical protein